MGGAPASTTYEESFARTYDATYDVVRAGSGDVAFYTSLAGAAGGPVCEVGCGTGRVLLPIARGGVDVTGVDPSPAMLEVLRAKGVPDNVTLLEGDFCTFSTGRRFALIYAPFRVFQHLLTVEGQLAALSNVRAQLAPGGRFVFDVFAPDLARMAVREEPEAREHTWTDGGFDMSRHVSIVRDHARQVMNVRFRFEQRRAGDLIGESVADVPLRWSYRYELEHLLVRAGFEVEAVYGGFDRRPYNAVGEIILVAKA